ncbi:MAG: hypothetical protein ABJD23_04375, partial [Nonlabens sp.]
MIKRFIYILLAASLASCQFFEKETEPDAVVILGKHYLDKSDIIRVLPADYTAADSTRIIDAYINKWATDYLLLDNARDNIGQDRQQELDELVENYRVELYAQEYLKDLTKQNLDTIISESQIKAFYESRKEDFKLNEDLVQFRYLQLDPLN